MKKKEEKTYERCVQALYNPDKATDRLELCKLYASERLKQIVPSQEDVFKIFPKPKDPTDNNGATVARLKRKGALKIIELLTTPKE